MNPIMRTAMLAMLAMPGGLDRRVAVLDLPSPSPIALLPIICFPHGHGDLPCAAPDCCRRVELLEKMELCARRPPRTRVPAPQLDRLPHGAILDAQLRHVENVGWPSVGIRLVAAAARPA